MMTSYSFIMLVLFFSFKGVQYNNTSDPEYISVYILPNDRGAPWYFGPSKNELGV